ncbi:MAG TPA: hypothetical protein VGI93_01765 [Steroidobacteraceae bacterium]|jgi:flavin-dependent dehydrogenase
MTHQVIVIGAGIAGSAVARRLQAGGARVALIGGIAHAGIEGLSERSVRLLGENGVQLKSLPAARTGAWGARRIEGREWLVGREVLAQSMRREATAAGVSTYQGWVRSTERVGDLWTVGLNSGFTLAAPWLIDARGRRGHEVCGPKLLAVAFAGRSRATSAPQTHIEPLDTGWCWWARGGGELFVQITRRPRAAPPQGWLRDAADELPELQAALMAAEGMAKVGARPAHARCAIGSAHDSLWRVGDSAWAPDPLSGQGVYEALRSAQLVSTALGSVFSGGALEAARRFVAERQAYAFERAVRIAADFYRENCERGPFWREIADEYANLLRNEPVEVQPHVEPRPVLADGRIVLRDVLVTRDYPRGVWLVGGVPIAPLFGEMTWQSETDDGTRAINQPAAAVERARRWLKQQMGPENVPGPALHQEFIRADH